LLLRTWRGISLVVEEGEIEARRSRPWPYTERRQGTLELPHAVLRHLCAVQIQVFEVLEGSEVAQARICELRLP